MRPTDAGLDFLEFARTLAVSRTDWTQAQWDEEHARIEAANLKHVAPTPLFRIAPWSDRGWPRRAIEAARAALETREAIVAVRDWNAETHSVLVLSGAAGCGKTVAAAWWAMHSPRYARHALFLKATEFAAGSRYDQETRDRWRHAHALVLDDLGMEYLDAKGSFQVDLDDLVDTYYADERPLIITTNLKAEGLKDRYGERVVDRLRECGLVLELGEGSMRGAR